MLLAQWLTVDESSEGLFAISKAKSGGESTFVSSITVHNELLKRGREVR